MNAGEREGLVGFDVSGAALMGVWGLVEKASVVLVGGGAEEPDFAMLLSCLSRISAAILRSAFFADSSLLRADVRWA